MVETQEYLQQYFNANLFSANEQVGQLRNK